MNPTHPSLRFQAHLAFPQGLPAIPKCQKSLQALPSPTHGLKDNVAKIKDRIIRPNYTKRKYPLN